MTGPTKINDSLLSALERPVLAYFARRIPSAIEPDHLTWLGLAGAGAAFAGYVFAAYDSLFLWLASFGIAVNWFGDSLDGTLARYRGRERPLYGFFIDHTTDIFAQVSIGFGLALSNHVRFEAASFALVAYLAAVAASLIRERVTGALKITLLRMGPTELRLGLIALNAVLFFVPREALLLGAGSYALTDLIVFATGAMTLAATALAAIAEARRLSALDRGNREH